MHGCGIYCSGKTSLAGGFSGIVCFPAMRVQCTVDGRLSVRESKFNSHSTLVGIPHVKGRQHNIHQPGTHPAISCKSGDSMEPHLASNALPAGVTCTNARQNACAVAAAIKRAQGFPARWLHFHQQGELCSFLQGNLSIVPTVQCDWVQQPYRKP